ncbi:MAG: AraC family transcriptional regulator [Oscillospiraceae bacterium]
MPNTYHRENREHSSRLIPFSYYKSRIPDYFPNVPLHCHKEFEINLVLSGCGEFAVGDDRFIADEGDIIIIQPNIPHSVHQCGNTVLIYDTLVFSSDMLLSRNDDRSSLQYIIPLSNHAVSIAAHITAEHKCYRELLSYAKGFIAASKKNSALDDVILKGKLFCFFAAIFKNAELTSASDSQVKYSELIRPSIEYINEHFAEKLTINRLADISHLSESYFMKAFKQCAGMGAAQYINQIRIKAACECLRENNCNISQIAFSCGFTNLSNFNRQFRRQVGISPREYSRKICNKTAPND